MLSVSDVDTLCFFSVVLLLSCYLLPVTGTENALESVPDLQKAMYLDVEAFPCVRLLNLSNEIGCSNPDRVKVVAPILRFKSDDETPVQSATILVSAEDMGNLFIRISNDQIFAKKVAGVLVESGYGSTGFSPEKKFPSAEFSPYRNVNYDWNPIGSSIMWNKYDFPVFLLSKNSTLVVQEVTDNNDKSKNTGLTNVAEFDLVMQTTKLGTHNSDACLKKQTCLPLGGYSVWSSLPPINITSSKSSKHLVLAITSMDSASFFRDRSFGADSPISGLISLLVAVDALSHLDDLGELKKQLVFLVCTGEAWGYLGSRRFLAELDMGSDFVEGLENSVIEEVLEIGSIGKASNEGEPTTFFAHTERGSSPVKDIFSAMEQAKDSLQSMNIDVKMSAMEQAKDSLQSMNIDVKMASTSNPGVPPSSLMSFLRKEFDKAFINNYYHSHLDDLSNIYSSSIVAAAALVARTLYILARGDLGPNVSVLNLINVNAELVDELVGCLLTCEPGLSCDLVKRFISPTNTCPNHYVGVFLGSPAYADDTSRFIWNFMANRTSIKSDKTSPCSGKCTRAGEVCVGADTERKGTCAISSTRYVPAYSTRLKYEDGMWHVLPTNLSDPLGLVDPVWTESYWNTIGLRVYAVKSSTYDHFILFGGVAVTLIAYLAVIFTRSFFMKVIKHD